LALLLKSATAAPALVSDSFTTTRVNIDQNLFDRIIIPGVVVETNVQSLLSEHSNRFVQAGQVGNNQVSAGSLISNSTSTVYQGRSTFLGSYLFAAKEIYGKNIKSYLDIENIERGAFSSLNSPNANIIAICILFSIMVFELGTWITEEISESREKIKFLLLSAGIPLLAYWIVTVVRLFIFVVPFLVVPIVFSHKEFVFDAMFYVLFFLQIFFLACFLGSFFPKATARGIMQGLSYGYILAFFILMLLSGLMQWKENQNIFFKDIFYFMGTGIPFGQVYGALRGKVPDPPSKTIVYVAAHASLYFLLLIAVEMSHLLVKSLPAPSSGFISFKNVTKQFSSFVKLRIVRKKAVDNLSLQINENEMFALLGPNGCGKTTSLSMLTAQQNPTSGGIHVGGTHVSSKRLNIIKRLGYCPQFDDLLIETMSVFDHLQLFCFINGMSTENTQGYVSLLLKAFGIESFRDYPCGSLSGGTKRKVSAAIAIMMPRELVVLDEASTGLDPLARQKLWSTVRLLNEGRTTIITTHYINETSVCDRIAIMNEGVLKACDTEHELTKLAKGYNMTLYFSRPNTQVEDWLHQNIFFDDMNYHLKVENLKDCAIVELTRFSIPLFTFIYRLAKAKEQNQLVDFSIGRMSLENIFLDMVRKPEKV
jgi:ABC-type multidrug transport system ATPase subunit